MRWREALVIGFAAASSAVYPLVAAADETSDQPPADEALEQPVVSGAPVAGPGVTAGAPAPVVLGAQAGTRQAGQAAPAEQGVQLGQPIVLPNTGDAATDEPPVAAVVVGGAAIGIGLLLGHRSRSRVGG
jgi:phosphate/sulfate permease